MILRLALVLAALAAAIVPIPATLVESLYSGWAYLALERRLASFSNRFSFALFDVLILAGVAWLVLALSAFVRRARAHGFIGAALRLGLRVAGFAAVVYLAFLLAWGLNYRRTPMTTRVAFSRDRVTREATEHLARQTVARVNELEAEAHRVGWPDWNGIPELLAPSFARVQGELTPGRTRAVPGLPKRTLLTSYFERSGVDGMTDPFFLETLVNSSVLPFERPSITAHEWAHLAGYADESEANFVGWIVCLQAPPAAEYSGHLSVLWQLLPALPRAERDAALRELHPTVRVDLQAIAARLSRVTPVLRRVSWRVYDRYLKANRVEKGVQSYDAALELLLGTQFEKGWVPTLRN